MNENLETFRIRQGTRSQGDEFEDKQLALWSLLLAQNATVLDFQMTANDPEYGSFDDIVIKVEKNGLRETVAIQLKHSQNGRAVPKDSFLALSGNFSLLKYFKETEKINIPEEVYLALFTNRRCNVSNNQELLGNIEIDGNYPGLEMFYPDQEALPWVIKFMNSNTCGQINQFRLVGPQEGLERFRNFLNRLYFYSSQDDVEAVHIKLQEQFLNEATSLPFGKFIENWGKAESKFKLNKETIIPKFLECLLLPYSVTSCGHILEQPTSFYQLFSSFHFTLFKQPRAELQVYDWNFLQRKRVEIHRQWVKQFGLSKDNDVDALNLLWHSRQLPKIIDVSKCPREVLRKAVILNTDASCQRHFVLVGSFEDEAYFRNQRILRDLSDLTAEELHYHFGQCRLNIRGEEHFLLDLINDDEELAKLFHTEDIASLLLGETPVLLEEIDLSTPYLSRQLLTNDGVVLDSEIFDTFPRAGHNKINLLSANPGMGKTVLMDFIRKTCPRALWPILVNVREYVNILESTDSKDILNEIIEEKFAANQLTVRIVKLMKRRGKIVLLWDGLNEIPQESLDMVLEKIENLSMFGQWVASRSHLKKYLEEKLQVNALNLAPLLLRDQIFYIKTRLKCDERIAEEIAEQLGDSPHFGILESPLELYVLTKLYEDKGGSFTSLTDIYNAFVTTKLDIFDNTIFEVSERPLATDELRKQRLKYLEDYQLMAITSCLDVQLARKFHSKPIEDMHLWQEINAKADSRGLIKNLGREEPITQFIHPGYAHFLCALYLKDRIVKKNMDKNGFAEFLSENKYHTIKYLLDMLLAGGSKSHLAVLYGKLDMIEETNFLPKDLVGRTPPDVAFIYDNSNKYDHDEMESQSDALVLYNSREHDSSIVLSQNCKRSTIFERCKKQKTLYPLEVWLRVDNSEANQNAILDWDIFKQHPKPFICCCIRNNFEKLFQMLKPDMLKRCLLINIDGQTTTLLHYAAMYGIGDAIITRLLANSSDLNLANSFPSKPLHRAAERGHLYYTELLLNSEIVNEHERDGNTPLILASKGGHVQVATFLLQEGADVNAANKAEHTSLMLASLNGHVETVSLLVETGVKLNVRDKEGRTALMLGSKGSHISVVEILIKRNADVNVQDNEGNSALLLASKPHLMQYLVAAGANVNNANNKGQTSLHLGVESGSIEIVKYLVSNRAIISVEDSEGMTPLMLAAVEGHADIIEYLVKTKAKVNFQDKRGRTALILAVTKGYNSIVQMLIEANAEVDLKDESENTALSLAYKAGSNEILKLLLGNGTDSTISTLLSAKEGNLDELKVLVEDGANVNVQDKDGNTPLILALKGYNISSDVDASRSVYLDMVEYLLQNGAEVNVRGEEGNSPLIWATRSENVDLVHRLVERRADVNVHNDQDETPMKIALNVQHSDITMALLAAGATID